jgi:hypothetical protein
MEMNNLLDLYAGRWNFHVWSNRSFEPLLLICAKLAEHVPLTVLDCNRRYDPSVVIRAARGRMEITDRIQSQRAFICYEVAKLLQRTSTSKVPILVLDMLSSFYDENVPLNMRRFLLEDSILHLKRLSNGGGVAVFVQPPPVVSDSRCLFERLQSAASQVTTYIIEEAKATQPGLF